MGAGASAHAVEKIPSQEVALSKEEIEELYRHLSCEYSRKVTELVSSRAPSYQSQSLTELPKQIEEGGDSVAEEAENVFEVESDGGYVDTSYEEEPIQTDEEGADEPKLQRTTRERVYVGKDVQRKLIELVLDDQPDILNMKVKVNPKVLGLLGDEKLDEMSRNHFDGSKITPKILARLGEATLLMPEKARKRLGSVEMSLEARKAMLREEEEAILNKERLRKRELEKVLKSKPGDDLNRLQTDVPVTGKAIDILGEDDESLLKEVREQKHRDLTISKKTIQLTGETKLLPKKVVQRRGSEMKNNQRRDMLKSIEKEEEDKRVAVQKEMHRVLQSQPTEAQLFVPEASKTKAKKLVQLAGEAVLPEKARKRLGGEMTPEQRKRMLEAELDQSGSQEFNKQ